ncbi:hypothetical protein [Sulfurivermis fontis]|uniref:hypothetical protein n=1 Tax=Sulfurivermis fontis TaxID=1972068 RepID=UPI000FDCA412|nr:hypothetical protein [Sulfurivermis fontis]
MSLKSRPTQQHPQRPQPRRMAAAPALPAVVPVRDEWWWSTRLLLNRIDHLLADSSPGNTPAI